jgi:hypothetical protein
MLYNCAFCEETTGKSKEKSKKKLDDVLKTL